MQNVFLPIFRCDVLGYIVEFLDYLVGDVRYNSCADPLSRMYGAVQPDCLIRRVAVRYLDHLYKNIALIGKVYFVSRYAKY